MVAFLHSPVGQRVRTNNHVERANRRLRLDEEVRYQWRSGRSLGRFLRLRLGRLDTRASGLGQSPADAGRSAEPARERVANPGGD